MKNVTRCHFPLFVCVCVCIGAAQVRVSTVTQAASGRPHGLRECGGGASCLLPPSLLGCCEPLGPGGVGRAGFVLQLCGGKPRAYSNNWRMLLPQVNSQKCLLVSVSSPGLVTLRLGEGGGSVSFLFSCVPRPGCLPQHMNAERAFFASKDLSSGAKEMFSCEGQECWNANRFVPSCRPVTSRLACA